MQRSPSQVAVTGRSNDSMPRPVSSVPTTWAVQSNSPFAALGAGDVGDHHRLAGVPTSGLRQLRSDHRLHVPLRGAARSAGLSQERLAEVADLDRTYMSGIERGERNPSLANLLKIADALGVRLSEIAARAEAMPP